jgi:tetratricopeptide (TPR) repeat protein
MLGSKVLAAWAIQFATLPSDRRHPHRSANSSSMRESQGNAHYELQQYEDALTSYGQAIRLSPNDYLIYMSLSFVLQKLGKIQEAEKAFEVALQLRSKS